jgi:hypothetical protein
MFCYGIIVKTLYIFTEKNYVSCESSKDIFETPCMLRNSKVPIVVYGAYYSSLLEYMDWTYSMDACPPFVSVMSCAGRYFAADRSSPFKESYRMFSAEKGLSTTTQKTELIW